jgi:hypothetical protein
VNDRDIDDVLRKAAGAQPGVDPELLKRISGSIGASMQPVRPLPAPWILTGGLILVCAVIAIGGALFLGPKGVQKMDATDIALIFPVLAVLVWLAARLCVAEAIPGSSRPLPPWLVTLSACLALAGVFALLFHDYGTEHFVPQGMACLVAGLAHAIPSSLATWWILSRGFAVNALAAGWAKGLLAGFAGVVMLELHCANFEAPHVIVWHIAVLPISAAAGLLAAWTIQTCKRVCPSR